jgi:hypothetical protein
LSQYPDWLDDLRLKEPYLADELRVVIDRYGSRADAPPTAGSETPQATAFLVMDESDSPDTGIEGMIGIVFPVADCTPIRHEWYRAIIALKRLPENHMALPPVIHGSKMLSGEAWATDEDRLQCYAAAVRIVNTFRLRVYRAAYYTASLLELRKALNGLDPRFRDLCSFGLKSMAAPSAAQFYMIPLFDGLDPKVGRPLAMNSQGTHAFRAQGLLAESVSYGHIDHYMDPVFADSRHSALIQIADVILYLLHVLDCEREGVKLAPFKSRLLDVAKTLDQSLVEQQIVHMQG